MLRGLNDPGGAMTTSEPSPMQPQTLTERFQSRRARCKAELDLLDKVLKQLEDKPELQEMLDTMAQLGV